MLLGLGASLLAVVVLSLGFYYVVRDDDSGSDSASAGSGASGGAGADICPVAEESLADEWEMTAVQKPSAGGGDHVVTSCVLQSEAGSSMTVIRSKQKDSYQSERETAELDLESACSGGDDDSDTECHGDIDSLGEDPYGYFRAVILDDDSVLKVTMTTAPDEYDNAVEQVDATVKAYQGS